MSEENKCSTGHEITGAVCSQCFADVEYDRSQHANTILELAAAREGLSLLKGDWKKADEERSEWRAKAIEAEKELEMMKHHNRGWKDVLRTFDNKITEQSRLLGLARRALEGIANPQCGCSPICKCLEVESVLLYRTWARETATEALAALPAPEKEGNR